MATMTPYSLRLPAEMRDDLMRWAAAEHRSLHSLILHLLDDALVHRQAVQESANAMSGIVQPPTAPVHAASLAAGVR